MDTALVEDIEVATLAWVVGALGHARDRGHTIRVGYVEAVVDDVVFEAKAAARGRGYRHGRYI